MSEQVKKDQEEVVEKKATPAKSKKVEKTEEKPGFFKRVGNWFGKHKRDFAVGGAAFLGGVGATVATGVVMNKQREKRERQQQATYIPEPEVEVSPLDPNV